MGTVKVSNKLNTFNVDSSNLDKAEADGYVPVVSVSNGQETHDVHPDDLQLALHDGYKPVGQMPSMGKSALMGAEQGLLLGGADETGGLIQAGLDAGQSGLHNLFPSMVGQSPTQANAALAAQGVKGNVGPTSEGQMYRQAQQENQQEYEEAQKANPGSYLAGNVAGGLLGMKGLGMAKLAPELIAAEKGAPGLRALAAKEGLGAAATEALKRGAVATVNAAPIGAAYGALNSKGTIDNDPLKIAKDAARGSATAGGIGLGLNLATEVGAPLAQAAMENFGGKSFTRDALKKFAAGRAAAVVGKGGDLKVGQTLLDNDALPMTGGSEGIANAIDTAQTKIGNERLSPILNKIQAGLPETDGTAATNLASQAMDLFDNFSQELSARTDGPRIAKQVERELIPYTKQIAEAGDDVSRLQQLKQGLQEQASSAYEMTAKGLQPTPKSDFYSKLASTVRQHIEDLGETAEPGLGDQLKQANSDWGDLAQAGKSVNKMVNKDATKGIISPMDMIETVASPHFGGPIAATNVASKVITGNPFSRVANIAAAKTANWLASPSQPNKVLDAGKSLYTASTEALQGFSQKLLGTPGSEVTGKALQNALQNNDSTAKNAVLFSIMQQPKLRKLIHGESDQTDQK